MNVFLPGERVAAVGIGTLNLARKGVEEKLCRHQRHARVRLQAEADVLEPLSWLLREKALDFVQLLEGKWRVLFELLGQSDKLG